MVQTPLVTHPLRSLPAATHAAGVLRLLALAALASLFLAGCSYIFEPPEEAAERFMKATANRDKRTIGEFVENKELEGKLHRLAGYFDGPRYQGHSGFWRLDGAPEEDDANGYTYVWVLVDIPPPENSGFAAPSTTDIVLEMERDFLRWTIHDVQGLDDLLARLDR